jgi:2-polyprenyl-3-methyl-5-hydroxy-6-metoxy-1,4-benzoquinol methylase
MDDARVLTPEKEKEEYLTHQNSLENEGYVNMFRKFLDKTVTPFQKKQENKDKLKALDYGSGPGDCVLAHILRQEKDYHVDIYDVYFAPVKVFTNKTYDLVTCTEVIEHLQNPVETLKLLKTLLKPYGILALMTLFHPIGENSKEGEAGFLKWWYRHDWTHISFFRPKTFTYIAHLLDMNLLVLEDRNITLALSH